MAPLSGRPGEATPKSAQATSRPNPLRHAASAVFAVTAIVPLMIFVWTLHRLGALSQLQSQVGLGLALGIALLGFYIFRRLVGQMSELIQALGKAMERAARSVATPPPAAGAQTKPMAANRPDAVAPPPTPAAPAAAHAAPASPAVPARHTASSAEAHAALTVPGLGAIKEVHDLGRAMAMLWQAEAAAFKGRRVIISVMNVPRQIAGTLVEVTDEGLFLETEGAERVAVSYKRLSAIDPDTSPSSE